MRTVSRRARPRADTEGGRVSPRGLFVGAVYSGKFVGECGSRAKGHAKGGGGRGVTAQLFAKKVMDIGIVELIVAM